MNRHKIAPVILVIALVAAGGWYWWSSSSPSTSDAVAVSGTVDADQVQVSSLVAGRVIEARLSEGDTVAAGDVIYRVDDAALRLQVDQANASVRATKVAWDQAVKDKDSKADIAAAKAQWQLAVAAREIAEIQLGYATVSSPTTGTVTAVAVTEGELASPGRTLATIIEDGSVFVRAFVPEPSIGAISVGQTADITTDSGDSVKARVVFVASQAQFTPSNVETKDQRAKLVFEVRLTPVAPAGLNPGMPVTVTFAQ